MVLAEPPQDPEVVVWYGLGGPVEPPQRNLTPLAAYRSRSMRTTVLLAACIASAAAFAPAALPKVASRKAGISGE